MQSIDGAYLELATKIAAKDWVKWVDLWHDQISALEDEYPFDFPAVFIEFPDAVAEEQGNMVQDLTGDIRIHLAIATTEDTFQGSINQESALEFLRRMNELYVLLHGKHGENYGTLHRRGYRREASGDLLIHYSMPFATIIRDYSAQEEQDEINAPPVVVEAGDIPGGGGFDGGFSDGFQPAQPQWFNLGLEEE